MEAGVDHLLREFAGLDEEPAAAEGIPAVGDGPVEGTITVASINSAPRVQAAADYVADTFNDEVELQSALDAYHYDPPGVTSMQGRPRVVVSAGHYRVGSASNDVGTAVVMPPATSIVGTGIGSFIDVVNVAFVIELDDYCQITNLHLGWGVGY